MTPKPPVKSIPQEPIILSSESREWIYLGLPSGTLWAKSDVENHVSFNTAKRRYGINVPSKKQAEELQECCTREWNPETKTIIVKGPNGNSISFHCPYNDTLFWLNTSERDKKGYFEYFGDCYRLGKDKKSWITDKDVNSLIGLHLVKGQ